MLVKVVLFVCKTNCDIDQLDVTLIRCLLINFSTNCTPGSSMRIAVNELIEYRNKLHGHVEFARISDSDYNMYKPKIECSILDIAKFCKIEHVMQQKLQDAYMRPLDQALCSQYQNVLLDEVRRAGKLETEIKFHLTSAESRICEHIDTISLDISHKVENINLHSQQHDAKLQSIEGNLKTEILEQESKFNITMHEHRQILEDTKKTLHEQVTKTESVLTEEIKKTAESLENKIDEYQKQTEEQLQNLKHTEDTTIPEPRMKHSFSDHRKDNLIGHTNARLQYHTDDTTFVETHAVTAAEELLEKHKILVLLAKAGSGKTTISLHIANTYKKKGYVSLLFIDKDIIQYRDLISVNEKSLVVVEDLFGRSNVQFEEDLHKNILDVLMSLMNSPNLRLILTIRNSPTIEEQILQKHDIFKGDCIMNLDTNWTLSNKEKVNILLRHMEHNSIIKCSNLLNTDTCLSYDDIPSCSTCTEEVLELPGGHIQVCTVLIYLVCSFDTYIGFPETCRMFCSNKRFTLLGLNYFQRTSNSLMKTITELFANSFGNINARYQYCLLVYTAMHNGILNFSDIYTNFDNDTLLLSLFSIFDDANIRIRRQLIQTALKELEETYLITGKRFNKECFEWTGPLKEDAYFFKHHSIFEAVLISFGTECPKEVLDLEICDIKFISSYIRPSYSSCREVETPILFLDSEVLLTKIFNILKHDSWLNNILKNCKITDIIRFDNEVRYQYTGDEIAIREDNLGNNTSNKCQEVLKNADENLIEQCDAQTLEFTITQENHFDQSERSEEALLNISDAELSSSGSTRNDEINEVQNVDCITGEESENDDFITDEESDNDEVDDETWPKEDEILHRYLCGESERVGMFIRTCMIESHYEGFVRGFFERLPISFLVPSKITDILNGLTRHGPCTLNLQLKFNKLKECILNYGTVKVCSLLLRPQSSNAMSHIYYQIDSDTIREKFFAFINETSEYEPIAEIGKYLFTICEEGNEKFVNHFLNEVIIRFSSNDAQKIMYLLDGFGDKKKRKETVSLLRDFFNSHLLKYGSVNVILDLCSIKNNHVSNLRQIEITREDFLKILTDKFSNIILSLAEHKYGITLKAQTQELGFSLYEFGLKINDDAFVEELISAVVKCYELYLDSPYFVLCHYNIKFLFHFTQGFTECGKRLKSAQEKYPRSMNLLETHCARYKIFELSVRKQIKKDQRGDIWNKGNFFYHLKQLDKLKPDANTGTLRQILAFILPDDDA